MGREQLLITEYTALCLGYQAGQALWFVAACVFVYFCSFRCTLE